MPRKPMRIDGIVLHTEEELITRLRTVTMLTAPEVFPYAEAGIMLQELPTRWIAPAQRYVLKENLERARDLRIALSEKNIDLYNLDGYASMQIKGEWIDLLPPVVEVWGENQFVLNDGMHRVYMAYLENVSPKCIVIRDIPEDLPYYAHVIPGTDKWLIPKIVKDKKDVILSKWHRPENKRLYRNFDSAFLNVGGPRG